MKLVLFLSVMIVIIISNSFSFVENCGRTNVKCGCETTAGDFPWLVGINDKKSHRFLCNGHSISKRYVLTAGTCLEEQLKNVEHFYIYVIAGQHNLSVIDENF
jgi:secreted trypsin-like serine protease